MTSKNLDPSAIRIITALDPRARTTTKGSGDHFVFKAGETPCVYFLLWVKTISPTLYSLLTVFLFLSFFSTALASIRLSLANLTNLSRSRFIFSKSAASFINTFVSGHNSKSNGDFAWAWSPNNKERGVKPVLFRGVVL